jgi:alpha-tubulin suppressor-like RCC1 family protein
MGFFSEVQDISAGKYHSLVLMADGTVYSFGDNKDGQLGHGDRNERKFPQKIEGLKGVRQVSAGLFHSLVLMKDGDVYGFGLNDKGQLGTGDDKTCLEPTRVALPDNKEAVQVAAGGRFSLVLTADGTVYSFGDNEHGQLGLGDGNDRLLPTRIEGLPDPAENPVVEVSAGKEHALLVLENGDVYSFGRNLRGQLGLGNYGDKHNKNSPQMLARGEGTGQLPADVPAVRVAAAVAGGPDDGAHSLILLENGDVYSCGRGSAGRLGQGDNRDRYYPTKVDLEVKIKEIGAGGDYSLAIGEDGQVYVCGNNDSGQLGLGEEVVQKESFTPVTGLQPAKAISGSSYSLVLMDDGTVYSFGLNNHGQLGQGTTTSLNIPTLLRGFEHIKSVSAGGAHSLLLLENGRVFSCGLNEYGQLGHGDRNARLLPAEIKGLPRDIRVVAVAAGRYHSLAVLENGEVYSWGYGEFGQLGHANNQTLYAPQKVVHLTGVVGASAGRNHSAVVNRKGEVFTFGLGTYGRLGHGDEVSYLYPRMIEGLPSPKEHPAEAAKAVSAGGWHTLVLLENGDVYAFGRNLYGELGLGDKNTRLAPEKMEGLPGAAAAIAAGRAADIEDGMHSLVLLENGDVYSFGRNDCGQLGLGDTDDRDEPTEITGLTGGAVYLSAGGRHSLVLMDDGKVHAFGQNEYGQLGLGDTEGHEAPAEIEGLADKEIVGVDAGGEHSLAVSAAGPVYSFGNTADGRIGRVPLQPEIPGPGNMKAVSAGDRHVLIALEDGRVFAYGHGSGGRLGHGDEYDRYEPVEIEGLPDPAENPAVSVAAGGGHSLVLLENGDVYAFGRNEYGQLGLGGGNDHLLPTRIEVLPAAVAVAAGGGHSLVLLENGDVYAFGRNEYGQLGLGDTDNREAPVKIEGLADKEIVDMDAGGEHSLVALADGSVYAFGRNEHGQLGLGDTDDRDVPAKLSGLPAAVAVAAGGGHSLVALADGGICAFGRNEHGQLGLGDTENSDLPVEVGELADKEIVGVDAGGSHSLALQKNGDVYAFGRNDCGQLGLESHDDHTEPSRIDKISPIKGMAAGHSFSVLASFSRETGLLRYRIAADERNGLENDVEGVIDSVDGKVEVTVPYGTDIAELVAVFELSYGAKAYVGESETAEVSGETTNDFTEPVVYTVVAEDGVTEKEWTVTVTIAPNDEADILAYRFLAADNEGVLDADVCGDINAAERKIEVFVPYGRDLDALIADFELSYGAEAYVGESETAEVSGETVNDFTEPVIYTVVAEDGVTTEEWTVTVENEPANTEAEILSFDFRADDNAGVLEDDAEGDIDAAEGMITVIVPFGTDVTELVAVFDLSYGAEARVGETKQVSGVTTNDFTEPVTYNVVAEDGVTAEEWTVTVVIAPNTEADFLSYGFRELYTETVLDRENGTIGVTVPFETDVTELVAVFELSPGAAAYVGETKQISGETANNFTDPVIYRVVAEDGVTEKEWTVTVTIAPNDEADILAYRFLAADNEENLERDVSGDIDAGNRTIRLTVPYKTDPSNLRASFSLSYGAKAYVGESETAEVSGETVNDFTAPVIYKVVAEDEETEKEWTVTVENEPASTEAEILSFDFRADGNAGVLHADVCGDINAAEGKIEVTVPYGTDLDALVADFQLSYGAKAFVGGSETAEVSGETANDFTEPVTYNVVAEDGVTEKEWTVTVVIAPNTETDFSFYGFRGLYTVTVLDRENGTIEVTVPFETDVTELIAVFASSYGAEVYVGGMPQVSGETTNDFTEPVIYTVVAEDEVTTEEWTVTVEYEPASTEAEILSFDFRAAANTGVLENDTEGSIDAAEGMITVTVPFGTDVTELVADFELSPGATAEVDSVLQVSGVTINDFTEPVIYTVVAEDGETERKWTVTVREPCREAELLGIRLTRQNNPHLEQDYDSGPPTDEKSFFVEVPEGTDREALVPVFELSPGAAAYVGETKQISGETANNFTDPVIYRVVAEDGVTEKEWTVIIAHELPLSDEAEIVSYVFLKKHNPHLRDDVAGDIDAENHKIKLKVHYGTDGSELIATFELSEEAIAKVGAEGQDSGETPNFFFEYDESDAGEVYKVDYTVVAQNGREQKWTVEIEVIPNDEAEILSFGFSGKKSETVIDGDGKEVTVTVPYGTDLKNLKAVFELSPGAVAYVDGTKQVSGVTANDFTNSVITPVTYMIEAQDGVARIDWEVTVEHASNTAADFIYFGFLEEDNPALKENVFGDISPDGKIAVTLPPGSDVSALVADFELSDEAEAKVLEKKQISGKTANDFTAPVIYTVVAGDGKTEKEWTVTVSVEPSGEAEFVSFGFGRDKNTGLTKDLSGEIDSKKGEVNIWTSPGSDLDLRSMIAEFELSPGAVAYVNGMKQTSGYSSIDFNDSFASPVAYTIKASDGVSSREWQVGVFLYGDVNMDRKITVSDAILVLREIVRLIELDEVQTKAAKVSGDNKDINVSDAILILRHIVRLIDDFPVDR